MAILAAQPGGSVESVRGVHPYFAVRNGSCFGNFLLTVTEFISTVPTKNLVDGSITKTHCRVGIFVEHGE